MKLVINFAAWQTPCLDSLVKESSNPSPVWKTSWRANRPHSLGSLPSSSLPHHHHQHHPHRSQTCSAHTFGRQEVITSDGCCVKMGAGKEPRLSTVVVVRDTQTTWTCRVKHGLGTVIWLLPQSDGISSPRQQSRLATSSTYPRQTCLNKQIVRRFAGVCQLGTCCQWRPQRAVCVCASMFECEYAYECMRQRLYVCVVKRHSSYVCPL